MLSTKINAKTLVTKCLIIIFLFSAFSPVQAGYVFSDQPTGDTLTEQTDDLKKDKKVKKKRFKKVKEKIKKAYKKAENAFQVSNLMETMTNMEPSHFGHLSVVF